MRRRVNIIIASVGGQGGLTLSRVIAVAGVKQGYSVRTGETLGMSQRYGSVLSFVRLGDEVHSPLIKPGDADYLLGLELIESLRRIHFLKESGVAVLANIIRVPVGVSLRGGISRDEVVRRLPGSGKKVVMIQAEELARVSGSPRAMNMVLLGAFHAISGVLSTEILIEAIREVLPGARGEASVKAFLLGYEEGLKLCEGVELR